MREFTFDVEAFKNKPKHLIGVLSSLCAVGQWTRRHDPDVEAIVCRTPNSALNYCRYVVGCWGVSAAAEEVFLKNPSIGIRYLRMVNRERFLDEKTQKRFWGKVTRNPDLAWEWANTFGKRLPEKDEVVLAGKIQNARQYAMRIVGGRLSDATHERIVLRSFENLDRWEKMALDEYLKFAERTSKKPEGAGA